MTCEEIDLIFVTCEEIDLKDLEKTDKSLLCNILEAPITTPKEYLYLETGTIPMMDILKCRRINYLYYILTCKQDEMLPKFLSSGKETKQRWLDRNCPTRFERL